MLQRFMKVELSRSTNFSRDSRAGRAADENAPRTLGSAVLNEKHSLIPSAGLQGGVEPKNVMRQTHQCPLPFYFLFSA
jgi:hypothetical protein